MRKGFLLAIGGFVLLAGCGKQGNNATSSSVLTTWKGYPYRLVFDTAPAKPNPAGITIPAVKYTANPDDLETRASLVVQFDTSGVKKKDQTVLNRIILAPFDISGAQGTLSADTMDQADKGLAKLLTAYCMKGKIKVNVMLVRSSISPSADDSEIDEKRLSDWLPIELDFKNPHTKCPQALVS